jgi:hypothetical protein
MLIICEGLKEKRTCTHQQARMTSRPWLGHREVWICGVFKVSGVIQNTDPL